VSRYGDIGRPVMLYETYIDWRDEKIAELQGDGMSLVEAHSKADFPSFLYGPITTSLYKGYTRVQPQYRRYGRVESLNDFRARRIRGLNGLRGIGYVGDQGEYPEMRRTERPSASLQIDTYGGIYSVTRQAAINDDSGLLLREGPEEMGYEAGNFVTEAVIAYIESNPTAPDGVAVFDATRNNTVAVELSEDALATAISTMENQVDPDGRRITIRPRTLAVKNVRMELIANRIINSQLTGTALQYSTPVAGTGTSVFDKGVNNPLQGILPNDAVVRDPFWTDANNWYLLSDPADVPAFAIGFLNGREEPQVLLKNPEARVSGGGGQDPYTWEVDSVDFKVRFDFGTGVVDPRGAYRGTPA
jgi:hypothetical protein